MKILLLSIVLVAACGDNLIGKEEACTEQAAAWCAELGFTSPGCGLVYVHEWCSAGSSSVRPEAQGECLEAIAENRFPGNVPTVCSATW